MANDKIGNDKLFSDDVLIKTIKEGRMLLSVFEEIKDSISEIYDASLKQSKSKPLDGYKNIDSVLKGLDDQKDAIESLKRVEQSRKKVLDQIEKASSISNKTLEELEKNLILQKKALSDLAKEQKKEGANLDDIASKRVKLKAEILATTTALQSEQKQIKEALKLSSKSSELKTQEALERATLSERIKAESKALRDSAKERAGLLSKYQKESKRLNELRNEYKELALEQGKNSKAAKALLKQITPLDKNLKKIDETVGQNLRSVGEYEKAFKNLKDEIKTFAKIGFIFKILEGVASAFSNNSRTGTEFRKVIGLVTVTLGVFISRLADALPILQSLFTDGINSVKVFFKEIRLGFLEATNVLGDNNEKIKELKKEIKSLSVDSGKGLGDLGDAFSGIGDEVAESIRRNNEYLDTLLKGRRTIIAYQKELSALGGTTKFTTKETESLLDVEARLEVATGNNVISLKERQEAAIELISVTKERNRIELAIAQTEAETARKRALINKDDIDAQEASAVAEINLANVRAENTKSEADARRELTDINSDLIERNLDFSIDTADKLKTINESIISDERRSFDERAMLLKKNKQISEDNFKFQQDEINKGIEAGKEKLDFDKLLQIEDTKILAKKIEDSGLNDRLAGRALEIIKEQLQVNKDLQDSEKELNESKKDSNEVKKDSILIEQALIEIEKEGADLSQILLRLSDQRLQTEIDNIRLRLATVKKGSEEEIKLQKELNEKLLEQQEAKNEKENDLNEKAQAKREEINDIAISGARALNDKLQDSTLSRVDAEIAAVERRQAALQEVAAKGDQTAKENIALEDKRRAELELKRERAIKRQQRIELGLAVLETYSNKVSSRDENALGSTITDTGVLLSFINSLPAFWTGSERVGDDLSPTIQGRDGHVVRVDGDERIVPGHLNKMIGGMSNIELATLAHLNRKPTAKQSTMAEPMLIDELRGVKSAIENKPVHSFRYDDARRATIDSVESKRKLVNHIRKNRIL